ncbi:MAG: efflux RND transporter periplasmic adaptor subunit [Gammaproteobacteria bacterium]|nr:MAG: efflux RND transporter periplasmic adaptor subunit [Gammaproteobacteria bacterium]
MNARLARPVVLVLLMGMATTVAQPGTPRVSVAMAERVPIREEVPLTGTLTSPQVAEVSTSVGGLVERIDVDVGDRVEAGALLVSLDREMAELSLEAARAATAQAHAELADVRRRLADARRLVAKKSFPESELRSLEAQVNVSTAAVARFEAEQKRQAARLKRHELAAPFPGVISRKLAETGEWVEPGTAVVELIATDGLRLDFRVPQHYYPRIDGDTRLQVSLDAVPDRRLAARIGTVVPVNDPSARTFLLRAYLDAEDIALTPGMSAHGVLQLNTGRQGVVVTRDALLRYPDGRVTVWLVEGDGETATVTERQVQTGVGFEGRIEIRGLEPGVRVVMAGNEALQEGQAVRVLPAK